MPLKLGIYEDPFLGLYFYDLMFEERLVFDN